MTNRIWLTAQLETWAKTHRCLTCQGDMYVDFDWNHTLISFKCMNCKHTIPAEDAEIPDNWFIMLDEIFSHDDVDVPQPSNTDNSPGDGIVRGSEDR